MLSQKVSGTSVGMWLLVPELLRLGAWDIIKAWTGKADTCLEPRIALQVVNETALCLNRVRRKSSLGHQGFQLANGMGRLVTDEQVHTLLNNHTTSEAQQMLVNLGIQRKLSGHYPGNVIAVDPHRIISSSKRIMAKKRKQTNAPSRKMLQTFFSVCTQTGQPIMATISSTGLPTSKATANLISATGEIIKEEKLIVADKEHFTRELLDISREHKHFDFLIPALNTSKLKNKIQNLNYQPQWAGFAIAETNFCFAHDTTKYRLIAERTGETTENYSYNAFITTSKKDAKQLICNNYDKRWSVEEFFRFENNMGLNRASTLNLNVRYGKLALAMIAQAATYQLRKKLKEDYRKWDASHLSNEVLAWADGDIRVKSDTILITFYGKPTHLNPQDYINLPSRLIAEDINPKIPWLYDYKIDFKFK